MRRPRIAFCYKYGLLGGVSAQLLNRYPYLSQDYDVSVIYEYDYGMASRFPAGVAQVAATVETMQAAIREIGPDITVVIDSPSFLDAWRTAGAPGRLVLEVHTTTTNLMYLQRREQLVGIAHIVTVSSYMEKLLGVYGLSDLAPISVVPNCLDDRWYEPSSPEQIDGTPVIWVGKLDGHKRWRTAVDLIDQLSEEPGLSIVPILVGGLTAPESEIEALTTRLATSPGLARGVWWPRVEYDRMPALYSAVGFNGGVHVCTTSNESFGMAVAESIVRGCPVVAPAVGALPELLPSAALYEPGDWRSAGDKARRALVDEAFRNELLSTADHVRELTAPQRVLEAYRGVVAAVLGSEKVAVADRPSRVTDLGGLTLKAPVVDLSHEPAALPAEPAVVAVADRDAVTAVSKFEAEVAAISETTAPATVVGGRLPTTPTAIPSGELSADSVQLLPAQGSARTAVTRSTLRAHAPFPVAAIDGVRLSSSTTWLNCELNHGETYRLRAIVEGSSESADGAAIARFDVSEGFGKNPGGGLALSDAAGPHLRLNTGPGLTLTDRLFDVANPTRRFAVTLAEGARDAVVKSLSIERVKVNRPTDSFISFDVEALPGRAPKDLIDSLIWGRINGNEYGISRICDVLADHGVTGNFMLDFASCSRDGESALRKIVNYLQGRGHEIHLHLHAEWLARWWGLETEQPVYLDSTAYDMGRRMMEYVVGKYVDVVGEHPRVFRSGGFRFNRDLVLAAGSLGIEALTNLREQNMAKDPMIVGAAAAPLEPFRWENGVLEIPVDISPEPLSESFEKFTGRYAQAINRKASEPTFNIVLHSWTLMQRNEQGQHDAFAEEHEQRLHQICQHITENGQSWGYSAYLDAHQGARPVTRLSRIWTDEATKIDYTPQDDIVTCNICDAVFRRSLMESDVCLGCSSRTRHRQMRHAFDSFGNVFDGRSVLGCNITPLERREFLAGALRFVNFDVRPLEHTDLQMDVQNMSSVEDASFDCFTGIHVLNHISDDKKAIDEIARVLTPNGVFVSTVPYKSGENTSNVNGKNPDLEAHTVSSRPYYCLDDYLSLLSTRFVVTSLPAFDPVTGEAGRVFLGYKGDPGSATSGSAQ